MKSRPLVLVTGCTGYVGSCLLPQMEVQGVRLRCLARDVESMNGKVARSTEVVEGDVLAESSLDSALRGVHTAYYLVHLMDGAEDFESEDAEAAGNFARAAKHAGIRRIVYLGGLGSDAEELSAHLKSRHEVGQILKESQVECIEYRASIIIGSGSASFNLVRALTDRLPVLFCPPWLDTKTQPIAIDDVVSYLLAALKLPAGPSRIFEIGGKDVVSYAQIIREYARQKGLHRLLIQAPILAPLAHLGLAFFAPEHFKVGRHLIEGLKNPTVVRDFSARATFPVQPIGIREAMIRALA